MYVKTAPTRRSVSELVRVGLDDAINNDIEGWNALLCELTGEPLLQDIFWRIEGVEDQSIQLRVTGYVEDDAEDEDWRREIAMEAGMGLGVDAYNDAMDVRDLTLGVAGGLHDVPARHRQVKRTE